MVLQISEFPDATTGGAVLQYLQSLQSYLVTMLARLHSTHPNEATDKITQSNLVTGQGELFPTD